MYTALQYGRKKSAMGQNETAAVVYAPDSVLFYLSPLGPPPLASLQNKMPCVGLILQWISWLISRNNAGPNDSLHLYSTEL